MAYRISIRQPSVDILLSASALASATLLLAAAAATTLDLGTDYLVHTGTVFGIAVLIVWLLALRPPAVRYFGAANRITLLRVALISLVAATAFEATNTGLSWSIIVVTTVALFLDGLDGRMARRSNTMSAFGARFDMETDAALIMVLSILCWHFGKAGIWILAAGAMRYCFVLASRIFRWLRKPLPYSRRRQAVCIWQSALLLGVISPVFPNPSSEILALGTIVMLGSSFFIDIRWLWVQHRMSLTEPRSPAWQRTQKR